MAYLTIGVDVDNVVNNLAECILKVFNEDTMQNVKITDIKSYYIENWVNEEYKDRIVPLFLDKRVWKQVTLIDLCQFFIKRLDEDGHKIVFVTSTEPENILKKFNWLQRNFPFIDIRKNLIATHTKQLVSGIDVLIDDYEKNLINGKYEKILFSYPWNSQIDDKQYGIRRCNDWREIYNEICKIANQKTKEINKRESGL